MLRAFFWTKMICRQSSLVRVAQFSCTNDVNFQFNRLQILNYAANLQSDGY